MIVLIEKASQKPVGQVAAAINENSTGWVSMFIVDEPHQGKGLGRQLFKAVEADFARKNTAIVGLDSVVIQRQTCEFSNCIRTRPGVVVDPASQMNDETSEWLNKEPSKS